MNVIRDFSLSLARQIVNFYRFNGLKIANWYFSNWQENYIVYANIGKYRLPLNINRSSTHRLLALQQEKFIIEREILGKLLRQGDIVFDVGANIGYMALFFMDRIGDEGQVFCFEPEEENLKEIRKVISVNSDINISIIDVAIGSNNGEVFFESGLNGRVSSETGRGRVVKVSRLDCYAEKKPSFIKVDVEGFEGQVLQGMQELIKEKRPRLFLEIHPHLLKYGISFENILNMLDGYKTIKAFIPKRPTGLIPKIWLHYFSANKTIEIPLQELVIRVSEGMINQTFWLVCSPNLWCL